jgi:hypothetical protein
MTTAMMKKVAAASVLSVGAYYALAIHAPAGPRSIRIFEPDRLAHLETRMWQAYYEGARVRLFRLLVTTLREQYRYPYAKAARAAFHLARAASTFSKLRGDYEQVLPDLEAAYAIAREWTGAPFDPASVARAELAWWVARRQPGQDDVASVGRGIATEYAQLYSVPVTCVAEAGRLRAAAAHLRDQGGKQADWAEIDRLLLQSFRALSHAVSSGCGNRRALVSGAIETNPPGLRPAVPPQSTSSLYSGSWGSRPNAPGTLWVWGIDRSGYLVPSSFCAIDRLPPL